MTGSVDFTNLKVGDRVFYSGGVYAAHGILKVTRITKTMVYLGNNRFRRKSGTRINNDRWSTMHVYPLTTENAREYKIEQVRNRLSNHKIEVTAENYLEIEAFLNKYNKPVELQEQQPKKPEAPSVEIG